MKRVLFLIVVSLLVIGIVLPGCTGPGAPAKPKIIIGVPYPAGYIQGEHMVKGAQLAAKEINAAGGVNITVGGNTTSYDIEILTRNSNEITDYPNAYKAVDWLIGKGAQYIIGGFRTEAVITMINHLGKPEVPDIPFFICGAATGELLSGFVPGDGKVPFYPYYYIGAPFFEYSANASHFKYIFRATPFNAGFLLAMVMPVYLQLTQQIQQEMGWGWNGTGWNVTKVKTAIFGENLTWAAPIIYGYQRFVNNFSDAFGLELGPVWTTNDDPPISLVEAYLDDIQDKKCPVILTCMSGPVGLTFGKAMKNRNITAIPVGINVEGQSPFYWYNSAGGAQYEIVTATWAPNVNNTPLTYQFIKNYQEEYNLFPIYTASSYDMVISLVEAFQVTNSLDKDAVCQYLENNTRVNTSGHSGYYPRWDQTTWKTRVIGNVTLGPFPALNDSQVAGIYAAGWYNSAFNFTMPPFTTHDLIFGPRTNSTDPKSGYLTGLCVQWQNVNGTGTQIGVWPKAGYDQPMVPFGLRPQTTLTRILVGLNWSNELEYPGTQNILIPSAYKAVWSS